MAFAVPVYSWTGHGDLWMGRHNFVHVPPAWLGFLREATSAAGLRALRTPILVTLFVAFFWCLYDQSSTNWVLQAEDMDLHAFGREWLPAQIHTMNPLLIVIFIPIFSFGIYPVLSRVLTLTPIRKIAIGLVLTALSFVVIAWVQIMIDAGQKPTVYWQGLAYIILTAAK